MEAVVSEISESRPVFVLFGASSFTGAWFAKALVGAGFAVHGILTRPKESYTGIQAQRIAWLGDSVSWIDGAPMGSTRLDLSIRKFPQIDMVGWHHALVGDYRSPDFPLGTAIDACLLGMRSLSEVMIDRGLRASVITHSVFESGMGTPDGGPPIGLYGVAKKATTEAIEITMDSLGVPTAQFVICNPVGPLESPRLTAYLVRQWREGRVPVLRAPHWYRDNIPIELLAREYLGTVLRANEGLRTALTPSFWMLNNRQWASRIADEANRVLGLDTPMSESEEWDRSEPDVRLGKDQISAPEWWSDQLFWETYMSFYKTSLPQARMGSQS